VVLGLGANWQQFALLALVNAFVGGMVGLERSIMPVLAHDEFGIASKTAAVSFIASFGLAKALANLFAGRLSERYGRKRLLVIGWLFGLPVPIVIMLAPDWSWVIGANLLLGINQGLTWSMTVNMKVDLVGPQSRGLALGVNEAAGYLSVAAAAYLTGIIAEGYGLRPEPFYLGIAFASLGLALSLLAVRDTAYHVRLEAARHPVPAAPVSLRRSFAETARRPQLVGVSQAGFVNNLNDGLAWGIFPLYFASYGLSLGRIALLASLYPLLWGALQPLTGWAGDQWGRRPLVIGGMLLQGLAIAIVGATSQFATWLVAVSLLGTGTALVYPTLLAAIGDEVHPEERASFIGVYRFWRDSGAAAGALAAGAVADVFGFRPAIQLVAAATACSGVVAAMTMSRAAFARPLEVSQ
jgi:MFS family permease